MQLSGPDKATLVLVSSEVYHSLVTLLVETNEGERESSSLAFHHHHSHRYSSNLQALITD